MSLVDLNEMVTDTVDFDLTEQRKLIDKHLEVKSIKEIDGLPRGFEVSSLGVFFTYERKDDKELKRIRICSELHVTALVRDRVSNNWGRQIEFKDPDGVLHSWTLPMEFLASDGVDMRKELSRMGLQIEPSTTARYKLIEYLTYAKPKARAICVQQTGWFDDVFVMPDRAIGESQNQILYQSDGRVSCPYAQNGSLEDWKDNVARLCIGNSRLMFAVAAAFSGMLLHYAKQESCGIHFVGASSCGKSTAQLVAASVYGGTNFKQSWRATSNALESICALHNDAALVLDEMAEVDTREIGNIVYMIGNGTGKARAGRTGEAKSRKTWSVVLISSGEIGLAQHMQDGGKIVRAGQEVRLIDIDADAGAGFGLFEELHNYQGGAKFSDAVREATQTHYGTAAIGFLERASRDSKTLSVLLKAAIAEFVLANLPDDAGGQVERICNKFALIAAAGEYATSIGITGWTKGDATIAAQICFTSWLKNRGGSENQEANEILSKVKAFFEIHGESRFAGLKDSPERITVNRAGFSELTVNGLYFYVLPAAYKKDVCAGFDMRQVSRVLIESGWLIPDSEGKSSQRKTLVELGSTRCYVFSPKMWQS